MSPLRIKSGPFAVLVSLGLVSSLIAVPALRAEAQQTPVTAQNGGAADDTPIVPETPTASVIALDQGKSVWTLKVNNGQMRVKGDVVVDSSDPGALWMANGSLNVTDGTVSVVGGVSRLGRVTMQPAASTGAHAIDDPLTDFRIPPPEKIISNEKAFVDTNENGGEINMPPGIYNGGIFATGKGHITMQPGLYVIVNGDFAANGPTVEGKGVTIVMAGDKPGALSFSLGAQLNISAPTEGKFKDLLVVSRASGTFARGVAFAVASGQLQGIVYCPTSSFSLSSKSQVQVTKIWAKSVDVDSSYLDVQGQAAGQDVAGAVVGN